MTAQVLVRRRRITPWLWRYGEPVYDMSRPAFVLVPFAGGSVYSVAEWTSHLMAEGHGVFAVQYPGRGPRVTEPHAREMAVLANNAAADLLRHSEAPLVLIGHSMGGAVAHEIAVRLEAAGRQVDLLVVSAARPPGFNRISEEQVLAMDRAAWQEELATTGFGEDHLLTQPEVLDTVIPVLRADYLLLSRHTEPTGIVTTPILAMGGDQDPRVTPKHLSAWANLTTGECATAVLPGGHFYYRDHLATFSRLIHRAMSQVRS